MPTGFNIESYGNRIISWGTETVRDWFCYIIVLKIQARSCCKFDSSTQAQGIKIVRVELGCGEIPVNEGGADLYRKTVGLPSASS